MDLMNDRGLKPLPLHHQILSMSLRLPIAAVQASTHATEESYKKISISSLTNNNLSVSICFIGHVLVECISTRWCRQ
jgi:hypothetical protein